MDGVLTGSRRARHAPFLLAAFIIVPVLGGCLISPWIFAAIREINTLLPGEPFARLRFERVATRVVQILALLSIWPCLKYSGTLERVGPLLKWSRERGSSFARAFAFGATTMIVVYIAGSFAGYYHWNEANAPTIAVAIVGGSLISATLVGILEEYLFRGFVFGILRQNMPFLPAAFLSSAFFSAIHFMRPRPPEALSVVRWTSGFELLPHLFRTFRPAYDWDFALTLFFMGVALCALLEKDKNFYRIAGLHAGWVWVLQAGKELVVQQPRRHNFWFGWGENPVQGALVTFVAAALAVGSLLLLLRRPHPSGRNEGPTKDCASDRDPLPRKA